MLLSEQRSLSIRQNDVKKSKPKKPPIALIRLIGNLAYALEKLRIKMLPTQAVMLEKINNYRVSQAIYVAAKLGIADLLKDRAKSSEELAQATGTHEPSLYRLLRALASVGIFAQDANNYFTLTPLAVTLQKNASNSMQSAAIMFCDQWHWHTWGDLIESVKTGKTALEHVHGTSNLFDYFAQNPEAGIVFDDAMTNTSITADQAILVSYDFSSFQMIVDVGGGQGRFFSMLLKAYPTLQGVLFDQASVIEGAKKKDYFEAEELASRYRLVAGDFFKSVPANGDAYILKTVIHDWDDESAIAILKNCRRVMPQHGKLLLIELVIPPSNKPSIGKILDLEMLAVFGGRERTEAEYRSLLNAAGFKLTKIVATPSPWSLIEGVSA